MASTGGSLGGAPADWPKTEPENRQKTATMKKQSFRMSISAIAFNEDVEFDVHAMLN